MKPVIVIAGVTGAGKTALSIEVAKRLEGEVVSADSMQIYKGMDIGTAKVTPEEAEGIPHHMLDVVPPEEEYSVARYVEDAARCCDDILSRGKVPIITGGTGLYIDSLLRGTDFPSVQEDKALRRELEALYDERGGEYMLSLLCESDPERAAKLSPGDKRRIIRALEVFTLTGKTATELDKLSRETRPRYCALYCVLAPESRELMYDRINQRVDKMLDAGLVEEVKSLLESGLGSDTTSMQAIGYKEIAAFIRGECSLSEAVEMIKMGSRRYAKRQLTWFRRREDALWLKSEDGEKNAELICENYLKVIDDV